MVEGCSFERADFQGARLQGSTLRGTRLAGANFTRANADRADFSSCDLSGATLTQCSLRDALLIRADLTDAATQAKFTDEAALKAMKEGINDKSGKVLMKPIENVSEVEMKALVGHVRTLKK